jgi:membrane-associated phospholipid phosphatase
MVKGEADAMWASFASRRSGLVAGISAMPSLHVAISFWIWLTARSLAPSVAPVALVYAAFMWVASVQLGWHYVSDGLAGVLGMLAVWWLAEKIATDNRGALTEPA